MCNNIHLLGCVSFIMETEIFFFLKCSKSCWMLRSGTMRSESCSRTCRTNVNLWPPSNTHCDGRLKLHRDEITFALSAPPFCLCSIFIAVCIKPIYIYLSTFLRFAVADVPCFWHELKESFKFSQLQPSSLEWIGRVRHTAWLLSVWRDVRSGFLCLILDLKISEWLYFAFFFWNVMGLIVRQWLDFISCSGIVADTNISEW